MPLFKKAGPQLAPSAILSGLVAGVAQALLEAGLRDRDALRPIKAPDLAKQALVVIRAVNLKTLTAELRVLWQLGSERYLDQYSKELKRG